MDHYWKIVKTTKATDWQKNLLADQPTKWLLYYVFKPFFFKTQDFVVKG